MPKKSNSFLVGEEITRQEPGKKSNSFLRQLRTWETCSSLFLSFQTYIIINHNHHRKYSFNSSGELCFLDLLSWSFFVQKKKEEVDVFQAFALSLSVLLSLRLAFNQCALKVTLFLPENLFFFLCSMIFGQKLIMIQTCSF